MSNYSEQKPGSLKRRRIVNWDPESEADTPSRIKPNKNNKKPYISISVGLLIALALFITVRLFMITWEDAAINKKDAEGTSSLDKVTAKYKFVSRDRVERFRTEAENAINIVKKLTDEHEVLLLKLLSIENNFNAANQLINHGSYSQAMELFDSIGEAVEKFKLLITHKEQANAKYDEFLVLIEENEKTSMFAPFEYEIVVDFGIQGRNAYETGEFLEAFNAFTAGINATKKMENKVLNSLFKRELKGKKALNLGDKEKAIEILSKRKPKKYKFKKR